MHNSRLQSTWTDFHPNLYCLLAEGAMTPRHAAHKEESLSDSKLVDLSQYIYESKHFFWLI